MNDVKCQFCWKGFLYVFNEIFNHLFFFNRRTHFLMVGFSNHLFNRFAVTFLRYVVLFVEEKWTSVGVFFSYTLDAHITENFSRISELFSGNKLILWSSQILPLQDQPTYTNLLLWGKKCKLFVSVSGVNWFEMLKKIFFSWNLIVRYNVVLFYQ